MAEPDLVKAASALETIEQQQAAGFRRGIYPRSFAILMAVWAGVLTTGMGSGNPWTFLWLLAGLGGFFFYRKKRGIWAQEIHNRRDLWISLAVGAIVLSTVFAGIVGFARGLNWAPYLSGAIVAVLLYGTCEVSYHHIWSPDRNERQ